ncbi:hypothetical protein V7S43_016546 [Phytophthora oleae]
MGQVSEGAALACSSAVQIFVRDLAAKMQKTAVQGIGLTPVELKKSVLASGELNFLHKKVASIDESDAKYHKPARRGKKRAPKSDAKKSTTKKLRTTKAKKATAKTSTDKKMKQAGDGQVQGRDVTVDTKQTPSISKARAVEVEEDDDYDESDSDT